MASLGACQARTPVEDLQSSQGESSYFAHGASRMRGSSVWVLASWNVRTLLDIDGSIETARKGVGDAEVVDERKIDQVVGELNRYKVDVAALQETKWFGSGVYEVGKSVVLAVGRHVPGDGVVKQRGRVWQLCCQELQLVHGRMLGRVGRHGVRGSLVSS